MGFIPDLGVSKNKEESPQKEEKAILKASQQKKEKNSNTTTTSSSTTTKSKKKIVSYYLEIDLIEKVKTIADQKDMYYSSLVTAALEQWLSAQS